MAYGLPLFGVHFCVNYIKRPRFCKNKKASPTRSTLDSTPLCPVKRLSVLNIQQETNCASIASHTTRSLGSVQI